jgi:hypothetical protein
MLDISLEFEMSYEPEKEKLTLIDYDPPNEKEEPFRLAFNNVKETEQLLAALEAWISLKVNALKNTCKNENG